MIPSNTAFGLVWQISFESSIYATKECQKVLQKFSFAPFISCSPQRKVHCCPGICTLYISSSSSSVLYLLSHVVIFYLLSQVVIFYVLSYAVIFYMLSDVESFCCCPCKTLYRISVLIYKKIFLSLILYINYISIYYI